MSFPLTKSHFLAGLQCPKRLWLAVCKPEYANSMSLTQQRDQEEKQKFKAVAQRRFQGIVIGGDLRSALELTQILLQEKQSCLVDAAFIVDDIFLRTHILRRHSGQGWQLLEAKPAPSIQEEHLADLALQAHVLTGAGLEPTEMGLILPNLETFPGEPREEFLLRLVDVTESVQAWRSQIPEYLSQFRQFLSQPAPPPIPMGNHCDYPSLCQFKNYCQGQSLVSRCF